MNQKILRSLASLLLVLSDGLSTEAQSPYFQAVTNLNPAGYWPMHEVEAPAPGDIEVNYGTLGLLGTGYYPDWAKNSGAFTRGATGAIAGDPDTCVFFTEPSSNSGGATNALYVPRTSPLTSLTPPFSVECWVFTTINNQGDVWSECGYEGLNAGTSGSGNAGVCGMRLYWNAPGFIVYGYYNSSTLNQLGNSGGTSTTNQWFHAVVTCDSSTNVTLYLNGNQAFSKAASGLFTPDNWTPFEVGNGRGNTRALPKGYVDEVAVYTNALAQPDIAAHYSAGTNAAASPTYFQLVTNDNPVIYLRMDSTAYTPPAVSTWPAVINYGTTNGMAVGNGVYSPGTMPGIVNGPANPSGVPFGGLGGGTVAQLSGISSFADVGNAPVYNPTGAVPFSVAAMFKGNPVDGRFQNIAGHSDNSWRLAMNTNGKLQYTLGSNSTSVVNSTGVYNDGVWHQLVEVYSPGSGPTVPGTNSMYVDGVLDSATNNVTTNGILPGSPLNMMIGADPQYTNNTVGPGRQFSGQVCEVAFFTNALNLGQVQSLYNASGVSPYITGQPITGRSVNAGPGTFIFFGVLAKGSGPLSYQWYYNSSPSYTGATVVTDGSKYSSSQTLQMTVTNLAGSDSGYYFALITNNYGSVTTLLASLTVNTAPQFTSQTPATYTNTFALFAGANPTLAVATIGAQPIYYQWFTNGVAVANATNAAFPLTNVQASFSNYFCTASNLVGTITSVLWSASVIADPTAPYAQSVLGLGPIGYWRLNEGPDDGAGNQGVLSHDYMGGNNGIYTNVTLAQQGYQPTTDPTTTSTEFGETGLSSINSYAGQIQGIDLSAPAGSSIAFSISAWVLGVQQTFSGAGIVTKGYGNGGEQFDMDVFANDFRFFVRDASGGVHGPTTTFKPDGGWHHVVAVCDEPHGQVSLYIDGQLAGQTTAPVTGGLLASTGPMSIGARRSASTTNDYNFQFLGFINDVAIYNYALTAAQIQSNYFAAGIPPSITQQPPSIATVSEGGVLTLSAIAYGSPTLSYHWSDNFNLVSQNGATLVISNVPVNLNNDSLMLTVSNPYGSTNSSVVGLNVVSGPPQLLASNFPPHVILPLGKSYTFSVSAIGTLPFHYQWFDPGLVAGQTNTSFTFTGTSPGDFNVTVTVSNVNGSIDPDSIVTVLAPPANAYASGVLGLHPVGYWPLQETNAPAPVTIETNYGSLGSPGNAYYAITTAGQSRVQFGQGGALSGGGDGDPAVGFSGPSGTNYAFIPRILPALTFRPPITLEAWLESSSLAFSDILSESGNGLNSPVGGGNWGGIRLSYAGNNGGGPALQLYIANGNGSTRNNVTTAPNTLPVNQWHHCVATYDGTNTMLYVDGTLGTNSTVLSGANAEAIDTWSPITIGDGLWQTNGPTRSYTGLLDEVAVYTNILSADQVSKHWAAGTSAGNYLQTVLNDAPLLYYRMDSPSYITPDPTQFPVAVNFGYAPTNGNYPSGTQPGSVAGPPFLGVSASMASPINGVTACIDAGNDPTFNPTNHQPFTALIWYKGNPSDARVQTLMSHGTSNWAMNLDGTTGRVVWNLFNAGQVTSTTIINDGLWHFLAGVYDGTVSTLYVDGSLNSSAAATTTLGGEAGAELFLGGNPDIAMPGISERFLAGSIAQAAVFTNALSASQIRSLYIDATIPTIAIATTGSGTVITFTGTLRSSSNAAGPYTIIPGATNPYSVPVTQSMIFYRTSNP